LTGLPRIFQLPLRREERFTALVRPHIGLMYRMAYRWTQSREESEDLVQDVLTRLVTQLDSLEQIEKLSPWLIKVLYRRYVDLYRRQTRSPIDTSHNYGQYCDDALYQEQTADSNDQLHRLELQRTLNNALAKLNDDQRDAVLLHDVEGHSVLDVADILEVSVGTVKSRLHRARNKLKKLLQPGTF